MPQFFQSVKELGLVFFGAHQVVAALLVEDLARVSHLGVSRIAEHDFAY